jgi:calmodulin
MTITTTTCKSQTSNIDEMREIFSLVDKDGGGTISTEELEELLEIIGIKASKDDMEVMVEQMDADNSGEIDFEEFAEVMTQRVECGYSCDEIKKAFGLIGLDTKRSKGCNKLHIDDIVKFLMANGADNHDCNFTEERVRYLVSLMESDQERFIDCNEYVEMMMNW